MSKITQLKIQILLIKEMTRQRLMLKRLEGSINLIWARIFVKVIKSESLKESYKDHLESSRDLKMTKLYSNQPILMALKTI